VSSELIELQLAWLERELEEYQAQIRLQSYLDAGFDPDLAAATVNAELHSDKLEELQSRVEALERLVALLAERSDLH
jgi:hypothetical protein